MLGRLEGAVSASLQPHHSDRDVIDLLNREVFSPMDTEADQRIQKAAVRASLGVSSCPHPALDAMKAAQDRLAAAIIGTAGEALVVARRMFALGALARAEFRPLPVVELRSKKEVGK